MSVSWNDVADALFPDVELSIQDYINQYSERDEPVTRFAPSPTGFLHIGGVFSAFLAHKYIKQEWWKFVLRIEDTDQKRLIDWGVDLIIDGMRTFGLEIDEWPIGENNVWVGDYGPYVQSERRAIYRSFVKYLVAQGKAYPCRMQQEEIDSIREQQMKSKIMPWIYGNYSVWRNKEPEEIMQQLQAIWPCEVIRFRSHGNTQKKIIFDDILRGKINMSDNYNDIVVLKKDGLPTYHLAHIADDFLMRTSHVIRGEERLTSVPLHLQLFEAFDLQPPLYCHLASLLKTEDGKKRKLSKRKDPEADVNYFWPEGYVSQGILSYLMTIIDPHYEEWQKANIGHSFDEYPISLQKMNKAWALFDLQKLDFMNNLYLSGLSNQHLFDQTKQWAKVYDPTLFHYLETEADYAFAAMSVERHTEKDPKRYSTLKDVAPNVLFFFDAEREKMQSTKPSLPEMFTDEIITQFVEIYTEKLDLHMDTMEWFTQLKEIGERLWFAANNAAFKQWWYIGKIGDLAMFLRVQLCCSTRTPDLLSVMKVMGKDRVIQRLARVV